VLRAASGGIAATLVCAQLYRRFRIVQDTRRPGEPNHQPVDVVERVGADERLASRRRWPVACTADDGSGCRADRPCDRVVRDDFVDAATVDALLSIAARGMGARSGAEEEATSTAAAGGPTIFDANSGYVMAPGAKLANVYGDDRDGDLFAPGDFALYRGVIRALKAEVEEVFGLPLYFTAPTFVARLSGLNTSWQPTAPHDEYWHVHVDRDNTAHYEYSGLLYLSTFGVDFDGGVFEFVEDRANDAAVLRVEPRRGRLVLFASTSENAHRVRRVVAGVRHALSFWFTCDPLKEFPDFLDGKMHLRYGPASSSSGGDASRED